MGEGSRINECKLPKQGKLPALQNGPTLSRVCQTIFILCRPASNCRERCVPHTENLLRGGHQQPNTDIVQHVHWEYCVTGPIFKDEHRHNSYPGSHISRAEKTGLAYLQPRAAEQEGDCLFPESTWSCYSPVGLLCLHRELQLRTLAFGFCFGEQTFCLFLSKQKTLFLFHRTRKQTWEG